MRDLLIKLVALSATSPWVFAAASKAAEVTGNANVTIIPAIAISEIAEVDFGTLSSRLGHCVMTVDGTLSGNIDLCSGNGQTGKFQIRGDNNRAIQINVEALPAAGLNFQPSASENIAARQPENATFEWSVGGKLLVSERLLGRQRIEYLVTANYE